MKRSTRIALLVAVCCIAVGSIAVFSAFKMTDFDLVGMSNMKFETKTYEIHDEFSSIEIYGLECGVSLVPSTDGRCSVSCPESEKIIDTVEVKNGTLTVTRKDIRKWYERIGFFFWHDNRITVYLPEREYRSLYLKTVSGEIEVPNSFSFEKNELNSVSGDISFGAVKSGDITAKSTSGNISITCRTAGYITSEAVSGDVRMSGIGSPGIKVKTTSGEISVVSAEVSGSIDIETVSGDMALSGSSADSMRIGTTSGDVSATSVNISDVIDIKTVSGDVTLSNSDAGSLVIKTTSGDVEGSLRTPKRFVTETTSGRVTAPLSSTDPGAGECRIKTTSGDIRISTP